MMSDHPIILRYVYMVTEHVNCVQRLFDSGDTVCRRNPGQTVLILCPRYIHVFRSSSCELVVLSSSMTFLSSPSRQFHKFRSIEFHDRSCRVFIARCVEKLV